MGEEMPTTRFRAAAVNVSHHVYLFGGRAPNGSLVSAFTHRLRKSFQMPRVKIQSTVVTIAVPLPTALKHLYSVVLLKCLSQGTQDAGPHQTSERCICVVDTAHQNP